MVEVITIDGPSGVGKGTAGKRLAKRLGWHFLDSGALYRLVALAALQSKIAATDVHSLVKIAETLPVSFEIDHEATIKILLANKVVTHEIRTEECGTMASKVSQHPAVRQALLQRQRDFKQAPGLIADGRDMGTVVFPEARVKFFLTASADVRAERRFKQLQESGVAANIVSILQEIQRRDERDIQRAASPLMPAEDAIVISTDTLSITEVLAVMWNIIEERISPLRVNEFTFKDRV